MNKLEKMNSIQLDEVLILPTYDYPEPHMGVRILIDGKDFLETAFNFEFPYLKKEPRRQEDPSQSRVWPLVNKQTRMMLRGELPDYDDGRSRILGCMCGFDDWPFSAKIILTDTVVEWKDFANESRPSLPYDEFGSFYFSRKEYDEQLKKLSG